MSRICKTARPVVLCGASINRTLHRPEQFHNSLFGNPKFRRDHEILPAGHHLDQGLRDAHCWRGGGWGSILHACLSFSSCFDTTSLPHRDAVGESSVHLASVISRCFYRLYRNWNVSRPFRWRARTASPAAALVHSDRAGRLHCTHGHNLSLRRCDVWCSKSNRSAPIFASVSCLRLVKSRERIRVPRARG